MPEIQKGSTSRVIFASFRINELIITRGDIKTTFSNFFVDNGSTPLVLNLEFQDESGVVTTLIEDESKSSPVGDTATKFYFRITDSLIADPRTYTIIPFWTTSTEKIYADNAIQLIVKDLHKGD